MPGVIVTGGAKGIGLGIASAFAESGYDVAIIDRDHDEGREAVRKLEAAGVKVACVPADLAVPDEVEGAIGESVAFLGEVGARRDAQR